MFSFGSLLSLECDIRSTLIRYEEETPQSSSHRSVKMVRVSLTIVTSRSPLGPDGGGGLSLFLGQKDDPQLTPVLHLNLKLR